MPFWWTCLFFIFANGHAISIIHPHRPVFYLKGSAMVNEDDLTFFKTEHYLCSGETRSCYCSGLQCRLVPKKIKSSNITILTLKYTPIETIQPKSFLDFESLTVLEILQSSLANLTAYSFHGLGNLRILNLALNSISFIHPMAFDGLESLEELILFKNDIKDIGDIITSILPNVLPVLEHLHLGGNPINHLAENAFKGMENGFLQVLQLLMCDLNFIHPKSFQPLKALSKLSLSANEKLTIENLGEVLKNFEDTNLVFVDMSVMRFLDIPTKLLDILSTTKVHFLMMNRAPFHKIRRGQFPIMPNLEILILNMAAIQHIEAYAFVNLHNLKRLVMQKNLLTMFPKSLSLTNLNELDISGFPAQIIRFLLPEFSFVKMKNLTILNLSFKGLSSLRKNLFVGLTLLEKLTVNMCDIGTIEEGTFEPLKSLETLDISHNPLYQISPNVVNIFQGLEQKLKTLIFQNGFIEKLDKPTWSKLSSLEYLDVSSNSLTDFPDSLNDLKNLRHILLSGNDIEIWEVPMLANTAQLETLDVSSNAIRTVTSSMLNDFQKLTMLNITHNPFLCSCDLLPFVKWLNTTNVSVPHYHHRANIKKEYYICNGPSQTKSSNLQEAALILNSRCENLKRFVFKPQQIALVLLAGLLVVLLTTVIFFYLFRYRILEKLTTAKKNTVKISFMFDAFVSYSSTDSEWVFNILVPRIENTANSIKLCLYDRDFIAGRAITDCIIESIKSSRKIILIISNNFVLSPWCRFETDLAQHVLVDENRDGLLIIKIGKVDLFKIHPSLRFLIQSRLYLSWSNDPTKQIEFWRKLECALQQPKNKREHSSFISFL